MCNCRYKPLTILSTTNSLIKIIYISDDILLVGKNSNKAYGYRKNGQTFYILEEDFDELTMTRVDNNGN